MPLDGWDLQEAQIAQLEFVSLGKLLEMGHGEPCGRPLPALKAWHSSKFMRMIFTAPFFIIKQYPGLWFGMPGYVPIFLAPHTWKLWTWWVQTSAPYQCCRLCLVLPLLFNGLLHYHAWPWLKHLPVPWLWPLHFCACLCHGLCLCLSLSPLGPSSWCCLGECT